MSDPANTTTANAKTASATAANAATGITAETLRLHRAQFPALATKRYFNYGGQGPLAQASLDRIFTTFQEIQRIGPFSGAANGYVGGIRQALRDRMAQELQVDPSTITLTEDVTMGCNIPLWGLAWQPGDHILMSDCEHPGVIAAVQEVQRRFGVEMSTCPLMDTLNTGDPAAVIAAQVQPKTKLVIISHILWNTGQVLPLKQIMEACRAAQPHVRVLVDAAQSVGVLPLALAETGVDFYAFTGHKWWCGPEGVGGLYVSPEARETMHPTYIGWRSINYSATGQPAGWQASGERYEVATSSYPLYAGLIEALDQLSSIGNAEERYAKLLQQSDRLWQGLGAIPQVHCLRDKAPEAGLVSFTLSHGQHSALVAALEKQDYHVRLIADPNCVRACVHYLTLDEEIDGLVGAIAAHLA